MSNNSRTSKTYQWKWSNDINTPSLDPSSQLPVKSTKQDKLAGPFRYSKHSSTSKTRRVRRSENTSSTVALLILRVVPIRATANFSYFSRKLPEKSLTGWIEAKKTPSPMEKCSTVTGVNRRPSPLHPSPPVKIRQIRMKRAVGPPFSLEPRSLLRTKLYYVRVSRMAFDFEGGSLGHRKRRDAIMF